MVRSSTYDAVWDTDFRKYPFLTRVLIEALAVHSGIYSTVNCSMITFWGMGRLLDLT